MKFLQEAKNLAGDRFVPALLTPGKLAREAACKAIQDEVGAKLVEKFGAEKVTDVRHQRRLLLHPEGSRPQFDSEQRQAP